MPRRKVSLGVDGEEPAVSSPPPEVKESSHAEVETESVELTASEESAAENIDETNNEVDLVSDGSDDEQKKTIPEENSNEPSEDVTSQVQSDEEVDSDVETGTESENEGEKISDLLTSISDIDSNDAENEVAEIEKDEFEEEPEIPQKIPTLSRMAPPKRVAKQINLESGFEFTPTVKQKWDDLYKALKDKRILKATIIKLVEGNVIAAQCQIKGYEEFSILVPNSFMGFTTPTSEVPKPLQARKIERMVGAEISLIIERLDYGSKLGIGNRALANYYLRRRYYYRGMRPLGAKRRIIVSSGTVINHAPIIGVDSNSIKVDLFGAVARIPLSELTHSYIETAYEKFHVGGKVNVIINEITKNESGRKQAEIAGYPVSINASLKALIDNNAAVALENASEGEVVLAKIKRFFDNGNRIILTSATGYNCFTRRVNSSIIKQLKVGSTVRVKLLVKETKRNAGIVDILSLVSLE